jgi:hypothetical protein
VLKNQPRIENSIGQAKEAFNKSTPISRIKDDESSMKT